MQQSSLDKMRAALAAAQQKVPVPAQQPAPTTTTQQPVPTDNVTSVIKSKLDEIEVQWNEGSTDFSKRKYYTWTAFNEVLKVVFNDYKDSSGEGYYKVKAVIKWENGKTITDRIDVGLNNSYLNPYEKTVGAYLQKLESVMYSSNLMKGERALLMFEDDAIYNVTVADITPNPDQPAAAQPAPNDESTQQPAPSNEIVIVQYSKWAFALFGEGTRQHKEKLAVVGNWRRLDYKGSKVFGWVFPNKVKDVVDAILQGEEEVERPLNDAELFLQFFLENEYEPLDTNNFTKGNEVFPIRELYTIYKA